MAVDCIELSIHTNTEMYALGPGVQLILVQGVQECDGAAATWQADQHLIPGANHVELVDRLQKKLEFIVTSSLQWDISEYWFAKKHGITRFFGNYTEN